MSEKSPHTGQNVDALIADRARRQYGHITRAQLLELGVSATGISRRVEKSRLIAVHAGVYAVGALRNEPLPRAAAAVLACGPGAAIGARSAMSLWGLATTWEFPLEVTTPREVRRPGIRTHICRTLTRADVRRQLGIRATSPARTLLDMAPRLGDDALARAVNDARLRGLAAVGAFVDLLRRCPTHPGALRLKTVLGDGAQAPTRSEFEDVFLALAAEHGLPRPRVNATLNGYEVDALFAEARVIVELDSWRHHSDRRTFERDRERDATALEHGYETLRVTWERLLGDPARELARLKRILVRRERATPDA